MQYQIIKTPDPQRGPYRVTTRGYSYAIYARGSLSAAHHWHPSGNSTYHEPHIHMPEIFQRKHFPCGRVSLEEIVRFCIRELGAEPAREDWASVLTMNEDRFQTYRSWPPQPSLTEATVD